MNELRNHPYGGLIAWFAKNSVAANLLMIFLLLGGLWAMFTITKEVQPKIVTNFITISVPYPGATPTDVEQGVIARVEEAIADIEGIDEIVSTAREGSASVRVEINPDYDILEAMDRIKMRVDAIPTLPAETEQPIYQRNTFTQEVIWVSVFGAVEERTLKEFAREVRDEIRALPAVTRAELVGTRDYEIAIELSEATLRAYGLTLDEVANAIRRSSLDLPGGRIRAEGGDILLRTVGQGYVGEDFLDIPVRTTADGSVLRVRDVAEVTDGFEDRPFYARHNGEPAAAIRVVGVGNQDALAISEQVRDYLGERRASLPNGISLDYWADISYYLQGRLNMMAENLFGGAVLVFVLLTLFLRLKLALWVMVGLITAFCGALFLLPAVGATINMISLFGFLVVLGIVVDDAIIMGESAYTEIREHGHSESNVINGVLKVAVPATFGVLTTIAAFTPIVLISGIQGQFFAAIGWVVILCLIMSLVESKLILPAHLAHMKMKPVDAGNEGRFLRFQRRFSDGLYRFVDNWFIPRLKTMMARRYATLVSFIVVFILSFGLLSSGLVKSQFFPDVAGDFMRIDLTMNEGSAAEATHENMDRINAAMMEVQDELMAEFDREEPVVRAVFAWSGSQTSGGMLVELEKEPASPVALPEFERRLREKVGSLPGVLGLRIGGAGGPGGDGPDLSFQLVGNDIDQLQAAAVALEQRMAAYDGVFDVRNSGEGGLREMQLDIRPEAERLGLNQQTLARQVRQAFYGAEAQRIQRGQDEVRVMVRYPEEQRRSPGYLEDMRIRTADGNAVPISSVADMRPGTSPSSIRRYDRERSVSVTGRVDKEVAEVGRIAGEIRNTHLPAIMAQYPGVNYRLGGNTQAQEDLRAELVLLFGGAVFAIYALLAIPLKSYFQPFLIMSVIPFGFVGALIGHALIGIPVSLLSFFGIIALAGVVVNDSLILVDYVNRHRRQGLPIGEAVVAAVRSRFRAIILTSATTFLGLAPIIFLETSLQAQIVIPMATSLAFGILFATAITLALIPILYLIGDDVWKALTRAWHGVTGRSSDEGESHA
jgi:multidrug efflux pump subunit AcrB